MAFKSKAVHCTTLEGIHSALTATPKSPVYVVGGGKTGMDTILAIQKHDPTRRITLIYGSGTNLLNRDLTFPTGLRRWFARRPSALIFRDCAARFDGKNAEDIRAYFVNRYATNRDSRNREFVWGSLSQAEGREVERAIKAKIWDYLSDVVDTDSGPQMHLRSGAVQSVPDGSIFVAGTRALLRQASASADVASCLSPNDVILTITPRHVMHVLASIVAMRCRTCF